MQETVEKKSSNGLRFSVGTIAVSVILAAIFFGVLLNLQKTYVASVSVLVSAKSTVGASQQRALLANMQEFPRTASFYARLLKFNPEVEALLLGKSEQTKAAFWSEAFSVEKISRKSSILKISMEGRSAAEAAKLASKTVRNLLDTTAFYYNVKNDVDLRIIDGPISKTKLPFWPGLLLLSLVLGGLTTLLIQTGFSWLKKELPKRKKNLVNGAFRGLSRFGGTGTQPEIKSLEELYEKEQVENFFSEKDFSRQAPVDNEEEKLKAFEHKLQEDAYPNFPEMVAPAKPAAVAPDNLPVADENFLEQVKSNETENNATIVEEKIVPAEEEEQLQPDREPTPEELKKRLNQLLRGEM